MALPRQELIFTADEFANSLVQIVPRVTEGIELRFLRAEPDRIFDAPMNLFGRTGKDRATLTCVIADRNYIVKGSAQKLIYRLRAMMRNIDPDLVHHGDGIGTNVAWHETRAENFKAIASQVPQ